MKLKFKVVLFILLSVGFILGCDKSNKEEIIKGLSYQELPLPKKSSEILLYSDYYQKFIVYDKSKKEVVDMAEENYFQYRFQTPEINVFTTGNSTNNNFKIIEYTNNTINVLHTMEENEAIFPLAKKNNNELFFVKYYYDEEGNENTNSREIVLYNREEDKLTSILKDSGLLISNGSYENSNLYFTAYNNEKDNYDVYKMKNGEKLEKIKEGILSSYINVYDEKITVDTEVAVDENGDEISKGIRYFFEDKNISLFNENNLLVVSDTKTNELIEAIDNVIGFTLDEKGEMDVYKKDGKIEINLN